MQTKQKRKTKQDRQGCVYKGSVHTMVAVGWEKKRKIENENEKYLLQCVNEIKESETENDVLTRPLYIWWQRWDKEIRTMRNKYL